MEGTGRMGKDRRGAKGTGRKKRKMQGDRNGQREGKGEWEERGEREGKGRVEKGTVCKNEPVVCPCQISA